MNNQNNYGGEVYNVITNSDKPPFYFVNIKNSEGTSKPNSHIWDFNDLHKAQNTILDTMERDDILKDKNVAKFVIAFPFGFVVYSWGDNQGTPDFNLMKQGEWEFSPDYKNVERQDNLPIFCPLENIIKFQETKLWCFKKQIKTISDYYNYSRHNWDIAPVTIEWADKPFY